MYGRVLLMRIKYLVVPVVAVLALTACGSSSSPAPTVTVTEQAQPIVPPTTNSIEDTFLSDVHALNDPIFEANSDSDIVTLGNTICSTLDSGATIIDILTYLITNGDYTQDEAYAIGEIIAVSIVDLCPKYTPDLEAFLASTSGA
jgi:hypothetical protein